MVIISVSEALGAFRLAMAVLEPLLKTVKSKHFVSGEKGMVGQITRNEVGDNWLDYRGRQFKINSLHSWLLSLWILVTILFDIFFFFFILAAFAVAISGMQALKTLLDSIETNRRIAICVRNESDHPWEPISVYFSSGTSDINLPLYDPKGTN